MSTTSDHDDRPRLGRVMVEARLLSEEQLAAALEEQARSGRQLGEVIAALGFASPGAIANALAEQVGGPLRTEYGIGTGLRRRAGTAQTVVPPLPPAAGLPAPGPAPAPPPGERDAELEELRTQVDRFGDERRTLLTRLNEQAAAVAAARQAAAEAEARLAAVPAFDGPPGVDALVQRLVALELELAAVRRERDDALRRLPGAGPVAAPG